MPACAWQRAPRTLPADRRNTGARRLDVPATGPATPRRMPHREHRDDTQRLACGVTSPLMLRTRRPRIPVAKFVDARALGGAQRPAGTSVPDQPARRLYPLNPEFLARLSSGTSDSEARPNGLRFCCTSSALWPDLPAYRVSSKRVLDRAGRSQTATTSTRSHDPGTE